MRSCLVVLLNALLCNFNFGTFVLSGRVVANKIDNVYTLVFFTDGRVVPISISCFIVGIILLLTTLGVLKLGFLVGAVFKIFSLSTSLSFFR